MKKEKQQITSRKKKHTKTIHKQNRKNYKKNNT